MNRDQLVLSSVKESKRIENKDLNREFWTTVVSFEELDLMFSTVELAQIKDLWLKGVSTPEIVQKLNRDENETFWLCFIFLCKT